MSQDSELLKQLAGKYLWWKTPEEALDLPQKIAAQVMEMGDYQDVQSLLREKGEAFLREVLTNAEAGQFNPRSWAYWHYRLGLSELGRVPPLPTRKLAP